MAVRGTTHAIHDKKVINLDHAGNRKVMCAWDICTNDGYESNKVRVRTSAPGYPLTYMQYVFCSERHRQFWINSIHDYGNLPSGYRSSIL